MLPHAIIHAPRSGLLFTPLHKLQLTWAASAAVVATCNNYRRASLKAKVTKISKQSVENYEAARALQGVVEAQKNREQSGRETGVGTRDSRLQQVESSFLATLPHGSCLWGSLSLLRVIKSLKLAAS